MTDLSQGTPTPHGYSPSAQAMGECLVCGHLDHERKLPWHCAPLSSPQSDAPHVPAAFVNALAEEGTRDELVTWLQKLWNENCALRSPVVNAADAMISEIEKRFPNWQSFRDLLDCIDCTLHDLRRYSPAVSNTERQDG